MKSNPMISPLRTTPSQSSQVFVDFGNHYLPSPLSIEVFDPEELDSECRGRTRQRSSLKSKLTDMFRPAHHRRRSSSVKSLGASSSLAPSYHSTDAPLPPYSPSRQTQIASNLGQSLASNASFADATRALYATRAIHPCIPPTSISYRDLPFFQLVYGDSFDVLREYGHPSTLVDLPLYVNDRARSKGGDRGCGLGTGEFLIACRLN